MTSISENEMNIRIPLCNVRYLNGISVEDFSGNLSEKDVFTEKEIQNSWERSAIFEILNDVIQRKKFISLIDFTVINKEIWSLYRYF